MNAFPDMTLATEFADDYSFESNGEMLVLIKHIAFSLLDGDGISWLQWLRVVYHSPATVVTLPLASHVCGRGCGQRRGIHNAILCKVVSKIKFHGSETRNAIEMSE